MFVGLEKFDIENQIHELLIKIFALMIISNDVYERKISNNQNIQENNIKDIEILISTTLTVLRKINDNELSITSFEDVSKILENSLKYFFINYLVFKRISSISYGFMIWLQHNFIIKNFSDATAFTSIPFLFSIFDIIISLHVTVLYKEIAQILKNILFMQFDHIEALTEVLLLCYFKFFSLKLKKSVLVLYYFL